MNQKDAIVRQTISPSVKPKGLRVGLIGLHFAEYTSRMALELAAQGATVQLHLSADNAGQELGAPLVDRLRTSLDLRLWPHPSRKRALLQGAGIARALRDFGPDILHVQEAAEWTVYIARTLGPSVPIVLTVHDPKSHSGEDAETRRRAAWPRTRLRRTADAIIVHGRRLLEELTFVEPSTSTRSYSVMHGTLGEPLVDPPQREHAHFVFFGRIEAYKGLGVLLEAVRLLADMHPDFRLTVAGRGQDLENYRGTMASMKQVELDERYIPSEEVGAMFARAGAVVMPYLDATQSGVAAYAFAAGAPVIASRVGGLPEIVSDGVNGLLVTPRNPSSLADAMKRILEEPGLAERLSRGAAETAATTLSWSAISADTLRVYDAASAGRKRKLLI